MKTKVNLLAAGIFLAAFANTFGQPTITRQPTDVSVSRGANVTFRFNAADIRNAANRRIVALDGGTTKGVAWGDYDNDGWLDLFVSNLGPFGPLGPLGGKAPNFEVRHLLRHGDDGLLNRVLRLRIGQPRLNRHAVDQPTIDIEEFPASSQNRPGSSDD
jgi:hypothetical protein